MERATLCEAPIPQLPANAGEVNHQRKRTKIRATIPFRHKSQLAKHVPQLRARLTPCQAHGSNHEYSVVVCALHVPLQGPATIFVLTFEPSHARTTALFEPSQAENVRSCPTTS